MKKFILVIVTLLVGLFALEYVGGVPVWETIAFWEKPASTEKEKPKEGAETPPPDVDVDVSGDGDGDRTVNNITLQTISAHQETISMHQETIHQLIVNQGDQRGAQFNAQREWNASTIDRIKKLEDDKTKQWTAINANTTNIAVLPSIQEQLRKLEAKSSSASQTSVAPVSSVQVYHDACGPYVRRNNVRCPIHTHRDGRRFYVFRRVAYWLGH